MNTDTTNLAPVFSPALMAGIKKRPESAPAAVSKTEVKPTTTAVVALDEIQPGSLVRPGIVTETTVQAGVIKAKHVQPGMQLRAFLKGEPRGAVRTVESRRWVEDHTMIEVTWTEDSPLPHRDVYKPAYRFHGEQIPVTVEVSTLVAYEQA